MKRVHYQICLNGVHYLALFANKDRITYLEFVGLDILPKGTDDDRSCLGMHSKESC